MPDDLIFLFNQNRTFIWSDVLHLFEILDVEHDFVYTIKDFLLKLCHYYDPSQV